MNRQTFDVNEACEILASYGQKKNLRKINRAIKRTERAIKRAAKKGYINTHVRYNSIWIAQEVGKVFNDRGFTTFRFPGGTLTDIGWRNCD